MNETLWAVIIGGVIAVLGSAVTQIILFDLNSRKENSKHRRDTLELLGYSHGTMDTKLIEKNRIELRQERLDPDDVAFVAGLIRRVIETSDSLDELRSLARQEGITLTTDD